QHPDGMVAVRLHQTIEGAAIAQRKIAPHLQIKKTVVGKERTWLANEQYRIRSRQQRKKNIQPQRIALLPVHAGRLGLDFCHGRILRSFKMLKGKFNWNSAPN